MAIERYSAKTDVVVKLILVFFVCLLSFSIGTFVGKKFSDNQYRLAQLEPAGQKKDDRGIASIPKDTPEVKPSDTLTDEEIAKLAEEFVGDDETVESDHNGAPAEKTTAPAEVAAAPTAVAAQAMANAPTVKAVESKQEPHQDKVSAQPLPAAQAVAAGKTPTPQEKKSDNSQRIPSSLPKQIASSPAGKYTVQVAAYAEEREAQTLSASLKDKGYSAFYVPAEVDGKVWYRVSVGLFNSATDAQSYRKTLLTKSVVSSAIVQKISKE